MCREVKYLVWSECLYGRLKRRSEIFCVCVGVSFYGIVTWALDRNPESERPVTQASF
jgi:hypothetical protein